MTARDTSPIRCAVVGFGTAGRFFHTPFLAADPAYDLRVIVTGDPDRAAAARAAHPGATVVSDPQAVIDHASELDLVVVATPPSTHVELAANAMRAGLDVVVDKPFAPTGAEGRKLIALAAELGRRLTVFQNRRWDADFLTLRRLLADGRLGTVHAFESRFEWWRPDGLQGWKGDTDVADGGGILFDLGTHLIDQALRLFGPVAEVLAEVNRRDSRAGRDADDDTVVILRHASGTSSRLTMSSVAALPGPRYRVLGSRAGYVKDGLDGQEAALKAGMSPADPAFGREPEECWGRLGDHSETTPVEPERGNYAEFYRLLATALRNGGELPVDPHDAVDVLDVIERAHACSKK
ncbi:Gfo/Idh/MocA family oxidoreductase [Nonomuraea sp. NEAU-A123]|uniref:Gfo/Idh/MocA family protein n=1 Tax=Nonomuraea sp. NEAU-A123 TaxID=2839649 RepID=UPI001BE412CE|nr:Gfo/Idh/MocA family oxidoreductase [Nonomuraea sp. NEAU-A123]MBT2233297.1 Gfo/Idh/MocA family oxidoreductase [Nonomuraea sp. NEAU-A123]